MKISAAILAVFVGTAYAGKPNLSITVKDGSFGGLDGFDPKVTYESSGKAGDIDIEYGIDATVKPTTDIGSLPTSIWGKASTTVSGWGLSAKAEIDPQDTASTDVNIDASNDDLDLSVKVEGSLAGSNDFTVNNVEVTKGINLDNGDGRITINRRNNIESGEKDVVVTYKEGSTDVKITASSESQEVEISQSAGATDLTFVGSANTQEITISHQIDDDNRVAPTISRNGDLSIEWERSLGDDNSLTATLKPNDSIGLEWKDSAWTANVDMPLDGNMISGSTVSIQRDVDF